MYVLLITILLCIVLMCIPYVCITYYYITMNGVDVRIICITCYYITMNCVDVWIYYKYVRIYEYREMLIGLLTLTVHSLKSHLQLDQGT